MKELLYKNLKALKLNINKLNKDFPDIKIPKIIKYHPEEGQGETSKKTKSIAGKDMNNYDIERELAELQKKLKELE